MTDLTTLSDAELQALDADVEAEGQRRASKQRLLDAAWNLVSDAKNSGYSKAAVSKALTDVVNQAFA